MERISAAFSNLYWTGLISVHQEHGLEFQRYEMVADIIEAWNEVEEAGELLGLNFKVHYDPRQF